MIRCDRSSIAVHEPLEPLKERVDVDEHAMLPLGEQVRRGQLLMRMLHEPVHPDCPFGTFVSHGCSKKNPENKRLPTEGLFCPSCGSRRRCPFHQGDGLQRVFGEDAMTPARPNWVPPLPDMPPPPPPPLPRDDFNFFISEAAPQYIIGPRKLRDVEVDDASTEAGESEAPCCAESVASDATGRSDVGRLDTLHAQGQLQERRWRAYDRYAHQKTVKGWSAHDRRLERARGTL